MKRTPVDSSNIVSVGHEQTLEVEFAGGVYRYDGVPADLHQQLMAAESKGQFFASAIKGKYPFTKVAP